MAHGNSHGNRACVSRRDAITAMGVAGIAAAGTAGAHRLAQAAESAGSAQQSASGQDAADAGESTGEAAGLQARGERPVPDATYGSVLNPQSSTEVEGDVDVSAIFEPLELSGHTMSNRIVKSCSTSELQSSTEWPDEASLSFYERLADGGAGMLVYESSTTNPEYPAMMGLTLTSDEGIAAHKEVADRLHEHGSLVIAQMLDILCLSGTSSTNDEATELESSYGKGVMMDTETLQRWIGYFIDAGERYYKAGFDGIELNASCNHFFSRFTSRFNNHERTDQYSGDSIENRCRVLTEIISGIRERVGDDFIIQVLYNAVEENLSSLGDNSLCTTVTEGCQMAELFEQAGASCLEVRSEFYGNHAAGFMMDLLHYYEHGNTGYGTVADFDKHFCGMLRGDLDGYAALLNVAEQVKSHVSIPVGVVGCMDPRGVPELLNDAIGQGKIDYLCMTRPLLADMSMPAKLEEGRRDECAPCTHCMTCFCAGVDSPTIPVFCRVNPAITRAGSEDMPEGYDPQAADESKKVVVVGGGPAGMQAAMTAARRGHEVTLFEREDQLGGRMRAEWRAKDGHDRTDEFGAYLERAMEVYGVRVETGVEADAQTVLDESPDVVFVCVGGLASGLDSDVEVDSSARVLTMDDVCEALKGDEGELDVGDSVVIVGFDQPAVEIAAHLVRRGVTVSFVNPMPFESFDRSAPSWPRVMALPWLDTHGVKVYSSASLASVGAGSVTVNTEYGMQAEVACDAVICATRLEANRSLYDELAQDGSIGEVYASGDCYAPGNIAFAVARSEILARRCGSGASNEAAAPELEENQYRGVALGVGEVTVTITVEDGAVVDATVDTSNETLKVGRSLGETFAEQIVSNGSIEGVSHASITSDAVAQAYADALTQAGLPVPDYETPAVAAARQKEEEERQKKQEAAASSASDEADSSASAAEDGMVAGNASAGAD
jgi:2,4-dienoyl-CoA reductase-like NADH-dependent reductase (Old Yellow Enzyme family)